jgi:hypothetical protein
MELMSINYLKYSIMKNIVKTFIIILAGAALAGCSKTLKVEDADASFIAYKLDGDKARLESSTDNLTVQLFTKTINGVDQNIAYVEFEFTGKGDLTSIWTGDSINVVVPKAVDGLTGEVTAWEKLKFASDYELFKADDFTQKGNLLNNGKLIYTYWKAGTYHVYMIASNWGEMSSDELSRDERMITVTVEDK